MRRHGRRKNRKGRILTKLMIFGGIPVIIILLGTVYFMAKPDAAKEEELPLVSQKQEETAPDLLKKYMTLLSLGEYEEMYAMLDTEASGNLSREDFVSRNSAIYAGMEMDNLEIEITGYEPEGEIVTYHSSFDTVAGNISFENEALFLPGEEGLRLVWSDSLIFPGMGFGDKVRVSATQAERGRIVDRNGEVLAGKGVVSSVGIVPGKAEEGETVQRVAEILGMEEETIRKKLSAGWVKEDSFVPLKLIPRVDERKLTSPEADEETVRELERHEKLLEVPGVMIQDQTVRSYPMGEAAAHLVGYVQGVTAEDLEKHTGEGYTAASVIGRSGLESLFETELRGKNGYRIYITDRDGREKRELACTAVQHGKDITLTIDAGLQQVLYEEFRGDKSCSVAMDPHTGEILALVSTPACDSNDFIMGISSEKWIEMNEDENMPLYNRFRQAWCPGSTFKPVTAAVGLDAGAIDPLEDFGNDGARWQKDSSWGGYYVTTLHPASPANLYNALIYSDNIYFAKAALEIGAEEFESALGRLGFGEPVPFTVRMAGSRFSNGETMESEIQLADSGYGQGQVLVNPLHLACLYTAFCNEGNMVQPWICREEEPAHYWIPGAFSETAAQQVLEALKGIVNAPGGTGYGLHREDVVLAGKTGTAEIKSSQSDTTGTELGWMAVFTAEKAAERPIMIVNMVEDVKGRGGSGYVVQRDREVLEYWFGRNRP